MQRHAGQLSGQVHDTTCLIYADALLTLVAYNNPNHFYVHIGIVLDINAISVLRTPPPHWHTDLPDLQLALLPATIRVTYPDFSPFGQFTSDICANTFWLMALIFLRDWMQDKIIRSSNFAVDPKHVMVRILTLVFVNLHSPLSPLRFAPFFTSTYW